MCGRYTLALSFEEALAQLNLELPDFDFEPRYNIAPSQRLPIILNEAPQEVQLLRWGLIPSWAKDPKIGYKMINARAETLGQKPAFRQAFQQRRCLVPADGFYEWQKNYSGKHPHHIHLKDRSVMTFAGLWEIWKDAEGRPIRSFTVITTTPNTLMEPIHDRMPAIIPPEERPHWLAPDQDPELLQNMLRPYPTEQMAATPVSSKVGNVRNDNPSLIEPELPNPTLF